MIIFHHFCSSYFLCRFLSKSFLLNHFNSESFICTIFYALSEQWRSFSELYSYANTIATTLYGHHFGRCAKATLHQWYWKCKEQWFYLSVHTTIVIAYPYHMLVYHLRNDSVLNHREMDNNLVITFTSWFSNYTPSIKARQSLIFILFYILCYESFDSCPWGWPMECTHEVYLLVLVSRSDVHQLLQVLIKDIKINIYFDSRGSKYCKTVSR